MDDEEALTELSGAILTGMSLTRELMKIRPDIPPVLSTGYSDLVSPTTARAAGIAEFLTKPVERSILAQTVRTVLDGKSGKVTRHTFLD